MQTFITDHNLKASARNLDQKRLGKQRVEAIQILRTLLGLKQGWSNHPAVKMWRGYEPFLLYRYLVSIMDEWKRRGYKNTKCDEHFEKLSKIVPRDNIVRPSWITDDFIEAHRSNLVKKNEFVYGPLFPNVNENLDYVWSGKD